MPLGRACVIPENARCPCNIRAYPGIQPGGVAGRLPEQHRRDQNPAKSWRRQINSRASIGIVSIQPSFRQCKSLRALFCAVTLCWMWLCTTGRSSPSVVTSVTGIPSSRICSKRETFNRVSVPLAAYFSAARLCAVPGTQICSGVFCSLKPSGVFRA